MHGMNEPAATAATFFADILAEIPPVERGIHSQTLDEGPGLRLIAFAFAPGEELSEHTAARPAIVHVLDGAGEAVVGTARHEIGPGTWFRMDAHVTHSIRARTPLRMLLLLLPPVVPDERRSAVD